MCRSVASSGRLVRFRARSGAAPIGTRGEPPEIYGSEYPELLGGVAAFAVAVTHFIS
jgi:hypothetical protein